MSINNRVMHVSNGTCIDVTGTISIVLHVDSLCKSEWETLRKFYLNNESIFPYGINSTYLHKSENGWSEYGIG